MRSIAVFALLLLIAAGCGERPDAEKSPDGAAAVCQTPLTTCKGPISGDTCECEWVCDMGKGTSYKVTCANQGGAMACKCYRDSVQTKTCSSSLGYSACNKNVCCGFPVGH